MHHTSIQSLHEFCIEIGYPICMCSMLSDRMVICFRDRKYAPIDLSDLYMNIVQRSDIRSVYALCCPIGWLFALEIANGCLVELCIPAAGPAQFYTVLSLCSAGSLHIIGQSGWQQVTPRHEHDLSSTTMMAAGLVYFITQLK